jgi:transcriptional regulator with XRE-family HTH domain
LDDPSLGTRIAARRAARGFPTQKALAERLGVHYSTVSLWESDRAIPRLPQARELARQLGWTVGQLFDGDHRPDLPAEEVAAG